MLIELQKNGIAVCGVCSKTLVPDEEMK